MNDSREVQLLSLAHVDGLRALSTEVDIVAVLGAGGILSQEGAEEYIDAATIAAGEGRSYVFVLTDKTEVLGACRLIGVLGVPRLIVAIRQASRGQGNGSFLVRRVLEFAFQKIGLERVTASGPCLRILAQFGRLSGNALDRHDWEDFPAGTR